MVSTSIIRKHDVDHDAVPACVALVPDFSANVALFNIELLVRTISAAVVQVCRRDRQH
jgi:hypothetical protein